MRIGLAFRQKSVLGIQRGCWIVLGLLASCSTVAAGEKEHALVPGIRVAKESLTSLKKVTDFTAVFQKSELVQGKRHESTMNMKFRKKPFSVYLLFTDDKKGQEVIYVNGQNEGKMLAHAGGLLKIAGTVTLDPTGKRAMKGGRYPITRIGIFNMLESVITQWEHDKKYPNIKLSYYPDATLKDPNGKLGTIACKVLVSHHPKPLRNVRFQTTRLYINKKTNLPVRVEQYGFPVRAGGQPILLEKYTYWNLRTNVGLKQIAFSKKNPEYKFK